MLMDLRAVLRHARLHPWFFAGAASSLAIGMSVATAVFSVLDAAILRPLPFQSPDRLVHIAETVPYVGGWMDMTRVPARHVLAARADAASLADLAAWTHFARYNDAVTLNDSDTRPITGARVTVNFFRLLGVRPHLGRDFDPGEGFGSQHVVLISHALWTSRFGADSGVVGRQVPLAGQPYRVIGVMPEGFGFPPVDAWFPLPLAAIEASAAGPADDDWPAWYTIARLAPGASIEQLSAELAVIYDRLYGEHALRRMRSSRARPLAEHIRAPLYEQLRLWVAIAILVGILCAVNFATMSLARGMRRRAELAVRAAMGASGGRIVRHLVVESICIALAGGVLAVVLGAWMLEFVELWFSDGAIVLTPVMNWPTMAFGLLATTLVGILFATAPAIDLSRMDLRARLQEGVAHATERRGTLRGRRLLVGLQLALALTAVATVAALMESDRRFWSARVGLEYERLLVASVSVGAGDPLDPRVLLERLRVEPAVAGASLIAPRAGVTAWTDDPDADAFGSSVSEVSPDYFATLGLGLIAGRLPALGAGLDSTPVVLLSRWTAVSAFGTPVQAIGRRLHLKQPGQPGDWVTVTGVVPDFGGGGLSGLTSSIYVVRDRALASGTLVIRAAGDLRQAAAGVRQAGLVYAPRVMVSDVRPARSIVDADRAQRRGRTAFVLSIGALALLLAVIGMYGLTAYNTEVRAREFGIRLALGAGPARLAHALLAELVPLALIGVLVALIAAGRLTTFLDEQFRNPLAEHPVVVFQMAPALASAVALVLVTGLGVAAPLWRVVRMDVMRVIQGGRTGL